MQHILRCLHIQYLKQETLLDLKSFGHPFRVVFFLVSLPRHISRTSHKYAPSRSKVFQRSVQSVP